jgi:hypothetical protein
VQRIEHPVNTKRNPGSFGMIHARTIPIGMPPPKDTTNPTTHRYPATANPTPQTRHNQRNHGSRTQVP